ncbi:hypothetical protein EVAR_53670_1 [Eumeta japonica]|uniref:Uncharacterized protein n=1 Tax=Eumeta variegata TaxID=151549 RepID=A0A4C1YRQ5_EUMVA|nr:hypothetical protein EVAR_53670_1 [Eumeta japonica]
MMYQIMSRGDEVTSAPPSNQGFISLKRNPYRTTPSSACPYVCQDPITQERSGGGLSSGRVTSAVTASWTCDLECSPRHGTEPESGRRLGSSNSNEFSFGRHPSIVAFPLAGKDMTQSAGAAIVEFECENSLCQECFNHHNDKVLLPTICVFQIDSLRNRSPRLPGAGRQLQTSIVSDVTTKSDTYGLPYFRNTERMV